MKQQNRAEILELLGKTPQNRISAAAASVLYNLMVKVLNDA